MSEKNTQTARTAPTSLAGGLELVPVLFRAVAALLVLPSGILKLVDYGGQAAFFAEIGVPAPGITVLLVAALELVAASMIATGFEGRAGALVVIPIMITAIVLAGLMFSNIAVLVACLGIVALGTGRYTVGGETDVLRRVGERVRR